MKTSALLVVASACACACCGVEAPRDEQGRTRQRFTVSKETTYFTGPLRADGTVDYVAALNEIYGAGVTPENNAAPALLSVLGEAVPEDTARLMGFERGPRASLRFVGGLAAWPEYTEWRRQHVRQNAGGEADTTRRLDDELLAAMARPWSAPDHPRISEWLVDMKPSLDAIRQAVGRPRHWIPVTALWERTLPQLTKRRNAADALRARAMLELGGGDVDGAVTDMAAVLRLGFLQAQGASLIDHLTAVGVTQIALEALPGIAAHVDRATALRMLTEIESLGPFPSPAGPVGRLERVQYLDGIAQLAFRGEWDAMNRDGGSFRLDPDQRSRIDWDYLMRFVNQHFDAVIECQDAADAEARRVACSRSDRLIAEKSFAWMLKNMLAARLGRSTAGIEAILDTLLSVTLSGIDRTDRPFRQLEVQQRLGETALLLKAHTLQAGRLPERLEDVREDDRHGVSVAPQEYGYRFRYQATGGAYTYTAVPEDPNPLARSFCVDGTGALVGWADGRDHQFGNGRCGPAPQTGST